MNRKVVIILILIGVAAIIGVLFYAKNENELSNSQDMDKELNTGSETQSSEDESNIQNVMTNNTYDENGDLIAESKYLDDDNDSVVNALDVCPGIDDFSPECEPKSETNTDDEESEPTANKPTSDVDKNGDPRAESTYLDEDGDTIANLYDICPGIDDFSPECEANNTTNNEPAATEPTSDVDKNGDPRAESTYLDEDGDTVANLYDICPGTDDFSPECEY